MIGAVSGRGGRGRDDDEQACVLVAFCRNMRLWLLLRRRGEKRIDREICEGKKAVLRTGRDGLRHCATFCDGRANCASRLPLGFRTGALLIIQTTSGVELELYHRRHLDVTTVPDGRGRLLVST